MTQQPTDILDIPYVRAMGIRRAADGRLELPADDHLHNHLDTLAAGAQCSLAEVASGDCLLNLLPEFAVDFVPVLRSSQVKYYALTRGPLKAFASVSQPALDKLQSQLQRRGRGLVAVDVMVQDEREQVTCVAVFTWFIHTGAAKTALALDSS